MTAATISTEVCERIAAKMVRKWRVRRVPGITDDDVRSEAILIMHEVAQNLDPSRGNFEHYLAVSCSRTLQRRLTRMASPASGRSNSDIPALMQLRTVDAGKRWRNDEHNPESVYEDIIYRTQVHARVVEVASRAKGYQVGLSVLFELTSVAEEAQGDKKRATQIYNCVRRIKQLLSEDDVLAEMLADLDS